MIYLQICIEKRLQNLINLEGFKKCILEYAIDQKIYIKDVKCVSTGLLRTFMTGGSSIYLEDRCMLSP